MKRRVLALWDHATYFVEELRDHRVQIGPVFIIGKERLHISEKAAFNLGREVGLRCDMCRGSQSHSSTSSSEVRR